MGHSMNTSRQLDQAASRRHWDQCLDPQNLGQAPTQRDFAREWAFYTSDEARFAIAHLPRLEGALCLELGAGLGTYVVWMALQGAHVVAVDFSMERLKALRQFARQMGVEERVHCLQCAAEHLPLAGECCDTVYTKSVLIHTRLDEALHEARRVLAPQGRAIFIEPLGHNPFAAFVRQVFAPQAWKAFTRYFDEAAAAEVARVFPGVRRKAFYLVGFVPFIWQFHWRRLGIFRLGLALARPVDAALFGLIAPLRRLAWFNVFVARKNCGESP